MASTARASSAGAAAEKGQRPTKGVRPKMDGVPGVLLQPSETPDNLLFGRKLHVSPYDALLRDLAVAPASAMLQFDSPRARASIYQRAQKLSVKVEFAELNGKLYVRIAPPTVTGGASSSSAHASPSIPSLQQSLNDDKRSNNFIAIEKAIRAGKKTPEAIAAHIRPEIPAADAVIVRSLLKRMQSAGTVTLAAISPERWEIVSQIKQV